MKRVLHGTSRGVLMRLFLRQNNYFNLSEIQIIQPAKNSKKLLNCKLRYNTITIFVMLFTKCQSIELYVLPGLKNISEMSINILKALSIYVNCIF